MRRTWLIFSQAVTVAVAVLFVIATLKPEWLPRRADGSSAVTVLPPLPAAAPAQPAASAPQGAVTVSYAGAARRATPAVVSITARKAPPRPSQSADPWFRFFFGDGAAQQPQTGLGSGVIVTPDGFLLTNNHVIEGADDIEVQLADGRTATARLVGTDPETDVAVLKIELERVPAVAFGNTDNLQVGDVVLAIGNPFGVGQTVTSGIVSALGRDQLGINTFENFIQTDAAINPGNSGGALIDTSGNLVGINTAIYSRTGGSMGIGFAIPVSTAKTVMEQIIRSGAVTRGWIGVEAQEMTPALAESFKLPDARGAVIAGVLKNGPADKGGMKPGDVLVEIEGQAVDGRSLLNLVAALEPGKPAKMKVRRQGQEVELSVTVGRRPKPQAPRE